MAVDAETKRKIERQARLYDSAKEEVARRIRDNVETAIKRLKAVEKALLRQVEDEFGENPFSELLAKINSENPPKDAEVSRTLARGVPKGVGPSEESFNSLLKEIEVLESWREKAVSVPSNVRIQSISNDSITLTWDDDFNALSYQIEADGSKSLERVLTNTFTKTELLPYTKHSFRVRAMRGNLVSEWSGVVKGKTQRESFESSVWKKCPDDVEWKRKYSVNKKNPRVVTKDGSSWCTIVGSGSLSLSTVTSWSIKVLKSRDNNGSGIFVGAVPFDIDQNKDDNHKKCGWYFSCYSSTLWSGPPYNYSWIEYGPRKENGKYVHTGDSVGVVIDTVKGDLSFILNGANLGVAYEGIPLDKPIVPCVLLYYKDDSVEFI